MMFLKQSTGITEKLGPILDETDGKTAETGLTIAQADVRLSKNGGAYAQKNEATSCTHDENGEYGCPLDTTDTGTLGRLKLLVHKSGALPVWHEYMVVPANVWDSLFSTDKLQVDLTQILGTALTETEAGYLAAAFKKLFDVAVPALVASDVMRGTNSAYTGTPPTTAQIKTAIEGDGSILEWLKNVGEGDQALAFDGENPATITTCIKDTGTPLIVKYAYQPDGTTPVTAATHRVGLLLESVLE